LTLATPRKKIRNQWWNNEHQDARRVREEYERRVEIESSFHMDSEVHEKEPYNVLM